MSMNKYEVVANIGPGMDMMRVVEAEDEKHARRFMWQLHMSDEDKNNCTDLEVFLQE